MKTAFFSILLLALTACSGGQSQETDKTAADNETSPSANGVKVCHGLQPSAGQRRGLFDVSSEKTGRPLQPGYTRVSARRGLPSL